MPATDVCPGSNASAESSSRRRAARFGTLGLLVCALGCSSASDEPPEAETPVEGGAGGDRSEPTGPAAEPAGNESNPAAPTAGAEGRDPNAIGNVSVPPEASAPAAPAAPPAEPSPGCGQLLLLSSGEQTIEVAGVTRSYLLDVPASYDGTRPYPLVFAFHGATTSGELFRSPFYGNLPSAMRDEAILVHPDALGDPSAWDNQADVPFFDAMLASLEAAACVDQARVFATGHSSGGFFTNALGCQRGDVLRAIAPVSAGGPFAFGEGGCTGDVAVWLAHAENDETVPFDFGVASRDRWLEASGCSDDTAPVEPAPCVEYTGCAPGLGVRWCVYDDGHDWPDFGPEGIWAFFSRL